MGRTLSDKIAANSSMQYSAKFSYSTKTLQDQLGTCTCSKLVSYAKEWSFTECSCRVRGWQTFHKSYSLMYTVCLYSDSWLAPLLLLAMLMTNAHGLVGTSLQGGACLVSRGKTMVRLSSVTSCEDSIRALVLISYDILPRHHFIQPKPNLGNSNMLIALHCSQLPYPALHCVWAHNCLYMYTLLCPAGLRFQGHLFKLTQLNTQIRKTNWFKV